VEIVFYCKIHKSLKGGQSKKNAISSLLYKDAIAAPGNQFLWFAGLRAPRNQLQFLLPGRQNLRGEAHLRKPIKKRALHKKNLPYQQAASGGRSGFTDAKILTLSFVIRNRKDLFLRYIFR
jgi:hypothetical protein